MYGRRGNVDPPQRIIQEDGPSVARDRYIQSLSSDIFGQPPARPQSNIPAGKRFDHSHEQMFAMSQVNQDATTRSLKAAPETFIPRDLGYTAQDRKNYEVFGADACYKASRCAPVESEEPQYPSNKMEGSTRIPHAHILAVAPRSDLLPSTAVWSNYSDTQSGQDLSATAHNARDRTIVQGVSQVFGTQDSQLRHIQEVRPIAANETDQEIIRRRVDQHFSNIFHKDYAPDEIVNHTMFTNEVDIRRLRPNVCAAEGLSPFQDAMDSRTELLPGMREAGNRALGSLDGTASQMDSYAKSQEIKFRSHIPGMEHTNGEYESEKRTYRQEIMDDGLTNRRDALNSESHSAVHQANLRSTFLERQGGYDSSMNPNASQFNLVVLKMTNVGVDVDERCLRDWARRAGCHVAKLMLQLDPITHTCKGLARMIVRESGGQNTSDRLIEVLRNKNIRVEIEETTDLTY
eukprot:GDKJ01013344.1.p1 GENE.GDKJ01013344.1~~GDKJ01013344.1.p1  ORF type:complete len:461 (-),score=102.52 GDKJ01013344.1:394-1776(-)